MSIETKVKKKGKTNDFVIAIWKDYRRYSSKEEVSYDWNVPKLIACLVALIAIIVIKDAISVVSILKDFNNIALTVVAILAGFNTASLSVIAASNTKVLGNLYASVRQDGVEGSSNLLRQTVSLFGYSIIIELAILVIGAILIFVFNGLSTALTHLPDLRYSDLYEKFLVAVLSLPWISFVFHSLFISIRNISILYNYILYLGHQAKEDNDSEGF
ncbi:hypothetical protein [Paenibacillus flagellatus]|uniref:Uncharacterized protein n=1 Tax=Paenibacillus flagellatus TaxID=2211139 RepID=A0A2V5JUT4_9BACL|nr:hypothetical protein [Paenibacillus flagellatus]PYI50278.1 hypothetical protein DLM86_29850 [Paenibacillus flagellatus]